MSKIENRIENPEKNLKSSASETITFKSQPGNHTETSAKMKHVENQGISTYSNT